MIPSAGPQYEESLREILERRDWRALREFARSENQIPDEVYDMDEHFWEVLMHKIICNRPEMADAHTSSRSWLEEHGYTTDIGGY